MKSKKGIFALVITCIVVMLGVFVYLFIPKIEVIENRVGYNTDDKPLVVAYNYFDDYTKDLKVSGSYDATKIGKYDLTYSFKFMGMDKSKKVEVSVEDMVPPVITLNGSEESDVCPLQVYEEEGYTSIDDVDGDITDKVIRDDSNKDEVVYTSTDSNNNTSIKKRKLRYVDNTPPTISLNEGDEVRVYVGNNYEEKGYSATDKCEGDLTANVVVSGEVDTNTIGDYPLTYTVSDSAGNSATVTRTVKVVRKSKGGSWNGNGDGKIYLTFDDGAGAGTEQILNILAKYNIKATFFVVNPNQLTVRAANEGHSIGLHSATHNYGKIYSSVDAYFADLQEIHDEVLSLTGIDSKIIRFPGGSSNTVSKNYCTGIMSQLVKLVQERGYSYFDWNVDCEDGAGVTDHDTLVNNVLSEVSHGKQNVVLMHDSKSTTAAALEDIITSLIAQGYEFAKLDENSTMVIHGVAN